MIGSQKYDVTLRTGQIKSGAGQVLRMGCFENDSEPADSIKILLADWHTLYTNIFRRCSVRISDGTPVILTAVFCGFPQSLLASSFQFVSHPVSSRYRT